MKALLKLCLFSALLALPFHAQAAEPPNGAPNCPMTGTEKNMGAMQNDMSAMMSDMKLMMASTADPAMKARMQKMQDRMGAMRSNMRTMGGGMMQSGKTPDSAPSAAPDDHTEHHPK